MTARVLAPGARVAFAIMAGLALLCVVAAAVFIWAASHWWRYMIAGAAFLWLLCGWGRKG